MDTRNNTYEMGTWYKFNPDFNLAYKYYFENYEWNGFNWCFPPKFIKL